MDGGNGGRGWEKKDDSGRVKEEKGEEGRQMLRIGRGWERREEGWGEVRGGEEEEMDNYRGREGGREEGERKTESTEKTDVQNEGRSVRKKKDYRKSEQLVIKREKEKRKKIRFWLSST